VKIFVLEDEFERIKWFKSVFSDCEIDITDKVAEACEYLQKKQYDWIFLDRDLSHPTETGEDVAWEMKEQKLNKNAAVIIHTMNTRGQRVMLRYIKEYNSNVSQVDFRNLMKTQRKDFD